MALWSDGHSTGDNIMHVLVSYWAQILILSTATNTYRFYHYQLSEDFQNGFLQDCHANHLVLFLYLLWFPLQSFQISTTFFFFKKKKQPSPHLEILPPAYRKTPLKTNFPAAAFQSLHCGSPCLFLIWILFWLQQTMLFYLWSIIFYYYVSIFIYVFRSWYHPHQSKSQQTHDFACVLI